MLAMPRATVSDDVADSSSPAITNGSRPVASFSHKRAIPELLELDRSSLRRRRRVSVEGGRPDSDSSQVHDPDRTTAGRRERRRVASTPPRCYSAQAMRPRSNGLARPSCTGKTRADDAVGAGDGDGDLAGVGAGSGRRQLDDLGARELAVVADRSVHDLHAHVVGRQPAELDADRDVTAVAGLRRRRRRPRRT